MSDRKRAATAAVVWILNKKKAENFRRKKNKAVVRKKLDIEKR